MCGCCVSALPRQALPQVALLFQVPHSQVPHGGYPALKGATRLPYPPARPGTHRDSRLRLVGFLSEVYQEFVP